MTDDEFKSEVLRRLGAMQADLNLAIRHGLRNGKDIAELEDARLDHEERILNLEHPTDPCPPMNGEAAE